MAEPKTMINAKVVELQLTCGVTFKDEDFDIQPFSQSSFIARLHGKTKRFTVIPTRAIDMITMEERDDEAVDQPET